MLILVAGSILGASLAAGQVAPLSTPDSLTPEVRSRLERAASSEAVQPWQRAIMLELAQGGAEGATSAPVSTAPAIALPLWANPTWASLAPSTGTPARRYFYSMIHDPLRDRMVVFAGVDGAFSHDDVWSLSLGEDPAWTELPTSGPHPTMRYGQSAIYDPRHDRMVVFGGYTVRGGSSNEVWVLTFSEGPAWSRLAPTGRVPAARYAHTAVYDAAHERMLVFGGFDGYGSRRDSWALSLSGSPAWSALHRSVPSPAARYGHSAVFDPQGGRMIVLGGRGDRVPIQDMWALSAGGAPAWNRLEPAGNPPPEPDPWPSTVAIFGGLGAPSGPFGETDRFNARSGFHIGGSFDYRITDRISVGGDASLLGNDRNELDPDGVVASLSDHFTTAQFGAHAKFFLQTPAHPVSVWASLGIGGYSLVEKWTVNYNNGFPPSGDEGDDKTGVRPGGMIGLGVDRRVSRLWSVGVNADFNYVVLDADKTDERFEFAEYKHDVVSLQYYSFHAGIAYHRGGS